MRVVRQPATIRESVRRCVARSMLWRREARPAGGTSSGIRAYGEQSCCPRVRSAALDGRRLVGIYAADIAHPLRVRRSTGTAF